MLIRWRQSRLKGLPQVFTREEAAGRQRNEYEKIHELYAEIGRLTTELEWLGKQGVRFR
jgi:hypothetical protein